MPTDEEVFRELARSTSAGFHLELYDGAWLIRLELEDGNYLMVPASPDDETAASLAARALTHPYLANPPGPENPDAECACKGTGAPRFDTHTPTYCGDSRTD